MNHTDIPANDVLQENYYRKWKGHKLQSCFPSSHHCSQINIIVRERPGI